MEAYNSNGVILHETAHDREALEFLLMSIGNHLEFMIERGENACVSDANAIDGAIRDLARNVPLSTIMQCPVCAEAVDMAWGSNHFFARKKSDRRITAPFRTHQ